MTLAAAVLCIWINTTSLVDQKLRADPSGGATQRLPRPAMRSVPTPEPERKTWDQQRRVSAWGRLMSLPTVVWSSLSLVWTRAHIVISNGADPRS